MYLSSKKEKPVLFVGFFFRFNSALIVILYVLHTMYYFHVYICIYLCGVNQIVLVMLQVTKLINIKKLNDGSKPARTKFDMAFALERFHWKHCFPYIKYIDAYSKEELQLIYLECLIFNNLIDA